MWRWRVGLLVFVLGTGLAWAGEPKTHPAQGLQTFLGLDDTSAKTQVQDGRAQALQNVRLDSSHSLRKRYGVKLIGNTLDEPSEDYCWPTGVAYTRFSSGTERILAVCGARAKYLNSATWTQVGSGATITAGQNNQFVFTVALDNLIATNNVDPPWQYNGTDIGLVSMSGLTNSIQLAKASAFFRNYLIFGNTREASITYATRIRWSNVGTITTWTNADSIDIDALGGQEVVALVPLYDSLYAFLTDSIYKISYVGGSQTFDVSKVSDIGCIAKNSIQSLTLTNAQKGLVYLSKNKRVYFFNGVASQDISTLIQTTMQGLSATRLQYALSAITPTDYILCATNGTATLNNLCLDFEYEIGEWTKHTNMAPNAMGRVLDSASLDQIYFGSSKSFVYQWQDTSNASSDIGAATGTVSSVDVYDSASASGLQVLYVTSASYTTGALAGAPINLVGGSASGQIVYLVTNTPTGLVLADVLSPAPTSTTTFEVGGIDAFYTTKWYDFGDPARLKNFGELYFWADADINSTLSISYARDFASNISTTSKSLASSATDSLWGTGLWGTALWGSGDTVFNVVKMETDGRFFDWKFADDDPGESFHLYGFVPLWWDQPLN